jgi:hypothetical protein
MSFGAGSRLFLIDHLLICLGSNRDGLKGWAKQLASGPQLSRDSAALNSFNVPQRLVSVVRLLLIENRHGRGLVEGQYVVLQGNGRLGKLTVSELMFTS